jgi:hypothetical protein
MLTGPELAALLARVTPESAVAPPPVGARTIPPHAGAEPVRDQAALPGSAGQTVVSNRRGGRIVDETQPGPDQADNTNTGPDPDLSRPFAA